MGFATPSGAQYGDAVAEGETQLVLDRLVERDAREYLQEIPGDPQESEVEQLLTTLRGRGLHPTLILTNIYQSFQFWEFKQFTPPRVPRRGLRSPEGYFQGIPILYSRLLPRGMTIAVDREALGNLEIKSDFDITVAEIPDQDRQAVLQQLPGLADEDLNEKIRVLCYEVVRAKIFDQNRYLAYYLLMTKGTPLSVGPPA